MYIHIGGYKMNYPDGSRRRMTKNYNRQINYQNRGMSLEEDINMTNEFYLSTNKAVIHKKPTPIQVVNVHYLKRSEAVITEAYYQQASTTDYNGVDRGKYIDFEAIDIMEFIEKNILIMKQKKQKIKRLFT